MPPDGPVFEFFMDFARITFRGMLSIKLKTVIFVQIENAGTCLAKC